MIRGSYGQEDFALDADASGRTRLAISAKARWACQAVLDGSWRVVKVELRGADAATASYRWDGDAWAGEIRRSGERREVYLPMAGGLEVLVPTPSFDGPFLRRVGLPPLSQRRIETLEIRPDSLEPVQSHCIIERLADSVCPWDQGGTPQARYRWTDELGRQRFVWARADGVGLGRAEGPEGPPLYRLEEGKAESAPSSSAR